jgi:hypothetical protein
MADEFEIEVSLMRADIARYNFHHIRWLLVLDTAGLVALLIMTYISLFHPEPEMRALFSSLLFWAVLIVAIGLSQPLVLFLQIYVAKSPAVESQRAGRVYRFNDDGIRIESEGRAVVTPWSKITALKDIGRLILIYTSSRLAYVIPRRCFKTDQAKRSFIRYLLERIRKSQ